ncbi:Pcc1-domain-containing protein [Polychaeton citri CBS 116435]|uniref:Pcc1-domain-containing protein n=1 Tax=Polychaeton citri CBS 116435 TaxID=1314669 RepID=A0A9P4UQV6_9PEZI|nr:Pcc1-domain-containing protein [Polychaeton citri CBS 116435]
MAADTQDHDFPCSLVIRIPFPTNRLAKSAIGTLSVDEELSPLVKRTFALVGLFNDVTPISEDDKTVLKTVYRATTNRMLRVAVNGFFESLNVVVQVMEELDLDVLYEKGIEGLEGVQGVEQGMTGSTVSGA